MNEQTKDQCCNLPVDLYRLKTHSRHSNIDSADGPISSHTQNSERSVLENCLNQCQLLLLLSELHLEILKLC